MDGAALEPLDEDGRLSPSFFCIPVGSVLDTDPPTHPTLFFALVYGVIRKPANSTKKKKFLGTLCAQGTFSNLRSSHGRILSPHMETPKAKKKKPVLFPDFLFFFFFFSDSSSYTQNTHPTILLLYLIPTWTRLRWKDHFLFLFHLTSRFVIFSLCHDIYFQGQLAPSSKGANNQTSHGDDKKLF